ncbi:MAG: hypothetical protein FWF98_02580 [Dehalococcoidia bacterium]|nr:hypothetical protein [Dehalococcoidia bacterium]
MKSGFLKSAIPTVSALLLALTLFGCGGSGDNKEYTLGDTVTFSNLELVLDNEISTTTVDYALSHYYGSTVIVVPVQVTNKSSSPNRLGENTVTVFGPDGAELPKIAGEFWYGMLNIEGAGTVETGISYDSNFHFLYEGNGDYYIKLHKAFNSDIKIKISVNI